MRAKAGAIGEVQRLPAMVRLGGIQRAYRVGIPPIPQPAGGNTPGLARLETGVRQQVLS